MVSLKILAIKDSNVNNGLVTDTHYKLWHNATWLHFQET